MKRHFIQQFIRMKKLFLNNKNEYENSVATDDGDCSNFTDEDIDLTEK